MGFWGAARRVFDLSLGEMLWSRRTIFMALVVGGPVLLALIVRGLDLFGMTALRVNGRAVGGIGVFGVIMWMLFLRFIVPVLAVFYGTALMADEIEDRTLTYLFTRPIPRGAVLVGKYLAYIACTILVVLPAVMLVYFLVVPFRQVPATFMHHPLIMKTRTQKLSKSDSDTGVRALASAGWTRDRLLAEAARLSAARAIHETDPQ